MMDMFNCNSQAATRVWSWVVEPLLAVYQLSMQALLGARNAAGIPRSAPYSRT